MIMLNKKFLVLLNILALLLQVCGIIWFSFSIIPSYMLVISLVQPGIPVSIVDRHLLGLVAGLFGTILLSVSFVFGVVSTIRVMRKTK